MTDPTHPALERLRALCLALPETSEKLAWGHPNFKAGKRTFVAWENLRGKPSIAFHVGADGVDVLGREAGFFSTPYGQGRWISLWVKARPNWRQISGLVERAYRTVALQRMLDVLDRRAEKQ